MALYRQGGDTPRMTAMSEQFNDICRELESWYNQGHGRYVLEQTRKYDDHVYMHLGNGRLDAPMRATDSGRNRSFQPCVRVAAATTGKRLIGKLLISR